MIIFSKINPNVMLCNAIRFDKLSRVKALIKNGADPRHNNDYPFLLAVSHGKLSIMDYLIELGVDSQANAHLGLRVAAESGHLHVVERLLVLGCDVHAKQDEALRRAAQHGHLDVVEYLLKNGADACALSGEALVLSVKARNFKIADRLLNNGAELTSLFILEKIHSASIVLMIKKHALQTTRGLEAVMMLDVAARVNMLHHLYHGLKKKQIREELGLMEALSLDHASMGAMWQAAHPPKDANSLLENQARSASVA